MDRILGLARRLGKAIAETDQFSALERARAQIEADPATRTLIEAFTKAQQHVSDLTRRQQPVEPEDKRRLADLQGQMAGSETIKALLKAEADYAEVMTKVNEAIHESLRPAEDDSPGEPGASLPG